MLTKSLLRTGQPDVDLPPSGQSRPADDAIAGASDDRSTASADFQLRAEASNLPFQPYTLACTPDGRFIATGHALQASAPFELQLKAASVSTCISAHPLLTSPDNA